MIKIQLVPAGYGDTIIVSIIAGVDNNDQTNLLIDCGFRYKRNILPRIKTLKKIDRFIITHYDSDHIYSAKKFIKENGAAAAPHIISIAQVWLNTFRHLQEEKRLPMDEATGQQLKEFVNSIPRVRSAGEEEEIGANQALLLGPELLRNKYPWNTDFAEKAVCVEHGPVVMVNDVKLTLLSPTKPALKKLEDEFIEELKKKNIVVSDSELLDDAFELFLQEGGSLSELGEKEAGKTTRLSPEKVLELSNGDNYNPDDASANGSSIAFILEAQGKRLLFLADAHAETIMESLAGHFTDKKQYPIFFDAVKVAHHGSFRNNNPELIKMIDSPRFLFSTNGAHQSKKHPDAETIACIVNRPLSNGIEKRRLIFNHDLPHLHGFKDSALKTEFKYEFEVANDIELE